MLSDHYNSDAVWHTDIFVELIKVPIHSSEEVKVERHAGEGGVTVCDHVCMQAFDF